MTVADKLTISRIILIPVFAVSMYLNIQYSFLYAAIVFTIAGITDILDGYIARKSNTVGDFGKVFDPIADKILVMSALVIMTNFQMIAPWIVIVFLAREFLISGYRIMVSSKGCTIISASWLGKLKTISQDILIVLLLLKPYLMIITILYLDYIFIGLALLFALWSMMDYAIQYNQVIKAGK